MAYNKLYHGTHRQTSRQRAKEQETTNEKDKEKRLTRVEGVDMEGTPNVRTLKLVTGAGMITKEFAQKVMTEALGAFNGIKISLEKGETVRRDTEDRSKACSKNHGEKEIPATSTPWGKRTGSRDRGEQELPAAKTPRD